MLTVVCIRTGTKYGDDYVQHLQRAVALNLSIEHNFVCFTNRPVPGVACRELPSALPGFWSKVGLFRPGVLTGEVLYFDLDVIVTGPLECFVRRENPTKVWALDDYSYGFRHPHADLDPTTRGLLGGPSTCNSSVMYWNREVGSDVWDRFNVGVMNRLHGDQCWITQVLWPSTLELYPSELACSYKYDVLYGKGAHGSVVVCHGNPKNHELPVGDPLRKQWLGDL